MKMTRTMHRGNPRTDPRRKEMSMKIDASTTATAPHRTVSQNTALTRRDHKRGEGCSRPGLRTIKDCCAGKVIGSLQSGSLGQEIIHYNMLWARECQKSEEASGPLEEKSESHLRLEEIAICREVPSALWDAWHLRGRSSPTSSPEELESILESKI